MNGRLGFLSGWGAVAAGLTLTALMAWASIGADALFSPGGLNAQAGPVLGGVTSHAQLSKDCGACHSAFWSGLTMADRCEACHADVKQQLSSRSGIHSIVGALDSPDCRTCHGEHHGPRASLNGNFDHNRFKFKLTGRHRRVPCKLCHTDAMSAAALRNTPWDCFACHAKDDHHGGQFGTKCEQCHTADGWEDATFDHAIFPMNHGREERVATCDTCHPNGTGTYSCYGCHEHTPARVAADHKEEGITDTTDCIHCHPGGREGGD